jgi:5-methylcytosine-specific restriction endonuclease McrA
MTAPPPDIRERRRRARNNRELRRTSRHWRRISQLAREQARGVCSLCGRHEQPHDQASKLTVDLPAGGDHSRATLTEVIVLCRRCHGQRDGGKPTRGEGPPRENRRLAIRARVGISLPDALKSALAPRSSRDW